MADDSFTLAELTDQLAETTQCSKSDARQQFDRVFTIVRNALLRGQSVRIPDFGTLSVHRVGERKGRNIATGAPLTVPAHRTIKFKPGHVFKGKLNPAAAE